MIRFNQSILTSAYLDSNIYIYGISSTQTNSRIILDAALVGKFCVVTSYPLLEEVSMWFKRKRSREDSFKARRLVNSIPELQVVPTKELLGSYKKYKGIVPKDDLPHFCAAKLASADYFASTNRHFIKEQKLIKAITPKEFVEQVLNVESYEAEY